MSISNNNTVLLYGFKHVLCQYRFGFEEAVVEVAYFPLDNKYFLMAKGRYYIQFDLGRYLEYKMLTPNFFKWCGLQPIWSDPVC